VNEIRQIGLKRTDLDLQVKGGTSMSVQFLPGSSNSQANWTIFIDAMRLNEDQSEKIAKMADGDNNQTIDPLEVAIVNNLFDRFNRQQLFSKIDKVPKFGSSTPETLVTIDNEKLYTLLGQLKTIKENIQSINNPLDETFMDGNSATLNWLKNLLTQSGIIKNDKFTNEQFPEFVKKSLFTTNSSRGNPFVLDSPKEFVDFFFHLANVIEESLLPRNEKNFKNNQYPPQYEETVNLVRNIKTIGQKLETKYAILFENQPTISLDTFLSLLKPGTIIGEAGPVDYPNDYLKSREDQLANKGITEEQQRGYSRLSNRFYRTVTPFGYSQYDETTSHKKRLIDFLQGNSRTEFMGFEREDAWKYYLGIPQEHGTFQVSHYKPTMGNDDQHYYYSLPKKEHSLLFSFFSRISKTHNYKEQIDILKIAPLATSNPSDFPDHSQIYNNNKVRMPEDNVMGQYMLYRGVDALGQHYISYYDKWDLSPTLPILGKIDFEKFAGNPFEIYGRIYYDPTTGDVVTPKNPSKPSDTAAK